MSEHITPSERARLQLDLLSFLKEAIEQTSESAEDLTELDKAS